MNIHTHHFVFIFVMYSSFTGCACALTASCHTACEGTQLIEFRQAQEDVHWNARCVCVKHTYEGSVRECTGAFLPWQITSSSSAPGYHRPFPFLSVCLNVSAGVFSCLSVWPSLHADSQISFSSLLPFSVSMTGCGWAEEVCQFFFSVLKIQTYLYLSIDWSI